MPALPMPKLVTLDRLHCTTQEDWLGVDEIKLSVTLGDIDLIAPLGFDMTTGSDHALGLTFPVLPTQMMQVVNGLPVSVTLAEEDLNLLGFIDPHDMSDPIPLPLDATESGSVSISLHSGKYELHYRVEELDLNLLDIDVEQYVQRVHEELDAVTAQIHERMVTHQALVQLGASLSTQLTATLAGGDLTVNPVQTLTAQLQDHLKGVVALAHESPPPAQQLVAAAEAMTTATSALGTATSTGAGSLDDLRKRVAALTETVTGIASRMRAPNPPV